MIDSVRYCPVTSLTIEGDRNFCAQRLGPQYKTDFSLLGGTFIYSKPEGYANEKNLKGALKINQFLINEILRKRESYIQIEDYSHLSDTSSHSRRIFASFLEKNQKCSAVIFCNLSLPLKTAVKLGLLQKKSHSLILIAQDYAQAVHMALEIAEREELPLETINQPFSYSPLSKNLFPIELCRLTYRYEMRGTRIILLNDRVLHFIMGPVIDQDIIMFFDETFRELMESRGLTLDDAQYFLVDCAAIKEFRPSIRNFAVKRMKKTLEGRKNLQILLYNMNSRFSAFIRLVTPLVSLNMKRMANEEEACRMALEKPFFQAVEKKNRSRSIRDDSLEEFLKIAASVQWDTPGIRLPETDSDDERLLLVKEIISLIKEEVDSLFYEKEKAEIKIGKMAEEKLDTQRKLNQIEKYAALGQLSAGMAHNINNTLTVIQGFVDLLMGGSNLKKEQKEYLSHITIRVEQSAKMISQLLSFSQKGQFQPCDDDLNSYAESVYRTFFPRIDRNMKLTMINDRNTLPVNIDRDRLNLAMENLIENGFDSMPEGGMLTLETSKVSEKGEKNCSFCHTPLKGEWAVLAVKDKGPGFSEKNMHRLFEPFYSTKEFGVGLGLSQVSGIISQHKGHIRVENRTEKGASIYIYLPLQSADRD